MTWQVVASRKINVREGDRDVDTDIVVEEGDTVLFSAQGQIWSGVWMTRNNGPKGRDHIDDDPKFPLPGSHPYGLLGKLDNGYFYIGDELAHHEIADRGPLYLRINDAEPGNGSGLFFCKVTVLRAPAHSRGTGPSLSNVDWRLA